MRPEGHNTNEFLQAFDNQKRLGHLQWDLKGLRINAFLRAFSKAPCRTAGVTPKGYENQWISAGIHSINAFQGTEIWSKAKQRPVNSGRRSKKSLCGSNWPSVRIWRWDMRIICGIYAEYMRNFRQANSSETYTLRSQPLIEGKGLRPDKHKN